MKIKIHNNDSTDEVIYVGNNIEDIRNQVKERIKLPTWNTGWSEVIER